MLLSEYQNGVDVIDSLLRTDSSTANKHNFLTPYQREGLSRLRKTILLLTITKTTTTSLQSKRVVKKVNTLVTTTAPLSSTRNHIPKKLLDSQEKESTRYLLSEFGGITNKSEKFSKWEFMKKAVNANSLIRKFQKKRKHRTITTSPLSQPRSYPQYSSYAPPEWYEFDRETRMKLANHLSWENLMKWEDFDIFEVSELSQGKPLLFVGWAILASPHSQRIMMGSSTPRNKEKKDDDSEKNDDDATTDRKGYNFLETYDIPPKCMIDFLRAIEFRYLPDNPYHNNIHAADVLQSTHSFIEGMGAKYLAGVTTSRSSSSPTMSLQLFSLLVGAVIHDVGHPGYNNAFQSKSFSETALIYNDISVLENYHASLAFQMILGTNGNSDFNIFKNMDPIEFVKCKRLITEAILGTDLKPHFTTLDEIKKLVVPPPPPIREINKEGEDDDDCDGEESNNDEKEEEEEEDVSFTYSWKILKFLMHMADISNLAKCKAISLNWTDRVLSEFFRQGDREKELGLPISPLCDRSTTSRSDSQMGFINFIIRPSFEVLQQHLPYIGTTILPLIEMNYEFWRAEMQQQQLLQEEECEKNEASKKADIDEIINIIAPCAA